MNKDYVIESEIVINKTEQEVVDFFKLEMNNDKTKFKLNKKNVSTDLSVEKNVSKLKLSNTGHITYPFYIILFGLRSFKQSIDEKFLEVKIRVENNI